ncbi:MAG: hypothetical protein RIR11_669 [Bacteroidota bacterium]|jgi:TPP-dependent 2-oxoacid decarboxylase
MEKEPCMSPIVSGRSACCAGSFAEMVPVLLINDAPTNKEDGIGKNVGLLYSHSLGNCQQIGRCSWVR